MLVIFQVKSLMGKDKYFMKMETDLLANLNKDIVKVMVV